MSAPSQQDTRAPGWALLPEFARLLVLAVLLPALALGALIFWRGSAAARDQAASRLAATAEANAREIDGFLEARVAALELLAESRATAGELDDSAGWATDLARLRRHYPAFSTLLVTDREGALRLSVPAVPGTHRLADRDYFSGPRRSDRAQVSGVFRGRPMGLNPLVALSAPLHRDGRFDGVVGGVIRTGALGLRDDQLRKRGLEVLLLDSRRTVVQASHGLVQRPLQRLEQGALDAVLAHAQGPDPRARMRTVAGVLREGGNAFAVAQPLANGWTLVVLQRADSVAAELQRNLAITLALAMLMLLGVLVIAGLKLRQLGGSVRGLLERMQHFALDRASAPIATDDLPRELAPLAETMNALAARARSSYDEVNASLGEQSRLREELQAVAQRLLTVQEDERRTLSRELHDDIGQAITAMKLGASALADDDPERREIVDEIMATADQTAVKLRNLSLLLRPPQLDTLGLEPALRDQVDRLARSTGIPIELDIAPMPTRLPLAVELACFRIAQEALTNAVRHAGADLIRVRVAAPGGVLELEVCDDGRGFDPARARGLGLLTMRERAQQLGGSFSVGPLAEGGTCVRATLPVDAPA